MTWCGSHTPSSPVQVEEFNHYKVEGIWETLDIHILRRSQPQGKYFETWHYAEWGENNKICANFFHAACNPWPNIFLWGKNDLGVAQYCESVGGSKVQGGETVCPPYFWIRDMYLCEGKKWRNKCPPISKVKILAETADWRNNWQVSRSTEGGSTSDKCGISVGSGGVNVSVTEKIFSVQSANTAMKMNGAISVNSATAWKIHI